MLSSPIFFKRLSRGLASRQMQNPPETLGCEIILGASLAPSRRVILAQVCPVYIFYQI